MITRSQNYHEKQVCYPTDRPMKDSFQPPVPDSIYKNQQEQIDKNQQEQIDKNQQEQIDEESDRFSISTDDYSEEFSSESESDDAETDAETDLKIDAKTDAEIDAKTDANVGQRTTTAPKPRRFFISRLHVEYEDLESEDEEETEDEEASPQLTNSESANTLESFLSSKPSAKSWKKSWPKEGEAKTTESACVNVYSYFEKGSTYGGYGVILRNSSAQPIATTANFSADGKSYLFQVFAGVVAGVRLAAKHGFSSPYVRCNSRIAVLLLNQITSHSCDCKGRKKIICKFCLRCACSMVPSMTGHYFKTLVPFIRKLTKLDSSKFHCVSRQMNGAAFYLAKKAKKLALLDKEALFDKKNRKLVDYRVVLEPNDFSEELISILLDDAYDSVYYNLDARGKLVG